MTDSAGDPAGSSYFRLPVSGLSVVLRHPTGVEDLLLLEAGADDTRLALALASRLTAPPGTPGPLDWRELAVADLDAVILRLRQAVIGDRVRADVACQAPACGQRIDISFGIGEYLVHHQPAQPGARGARNVAADEEPGWFRLNAGQKETAGCRFRLPVVADQLAAAGHPAGADELARRCIRPVGISWRLRRRVEAAMERMAPNLSSELAGTCPDCGATVSVYFDARAFCLREMRDRAKFIYQDIDLLARRYHWSETEILTMPHVRRTNYAELARQESL